ncbi:secreted RxLR effector protein 161-like [Aricia agestis]|uniref:secreted RxLR effector protein 161-like n=1 Tax=Aricia agestis TaxID=91739 RepID=UPI001C204E1E|nr:secreted RxLR effector protein 161-like [Aricia agestis]
MLSKYNNKPETSHWLALKRVMRYLKGTEDCKMTFKQDLDENMTHGFCDADWASSEDDRRSCTGYSFMFQGGTISWNSKRQPTVALSTTEAEYMSLSSCVQEAMWLKQLQECFWPELKHQAMIIYSDNQSSIKLSGTDGYHSRTKHIDVRHHFVRDKVMEGHIDVQYVQTDMMVADALTKATPYRKLRYCASKMGLMF